MKKFSGSMMVVAVATMLAVPATEASAQVFTPTYQAPRPSHDVGIYLSDGPGDFAVEGLLRRNFGGYDVGFRGGVADAEDAAILLGLDLRSPLSLGTAPIDVAFTAGAQGVIADASAFGFQGGLSFGYTFTPEGGFSFTPYIHPRVGLIDFGGVDDDLDLEVLADVGFDVRLASGLVIRAGFGLGNPVADWGFGLAW